MNNEAKLKELIIPAKIEELNHAISFLSPVLEENLCPFKIQISLETAVEEIFTNISQYAYQANDKIGNVIIQIQILNQPNGIRITFIDNGVKFNPLEKEDPDVTLGIEEREIGGLGIYLVKKSMDRVEYQYKNESNILWFEKYW